MAGTSADMRKAQLMQHLAHMALMVGDAEPFFRVLGEQVESGDSLRCDSVIHHSCREEVDMDG